MSFSKYHRNRLNLQPSKMNDPPLFFYGPSSFPRKRGGSFHEEVLPNMLYKRSFAVCMCSSKPYDEFYESMVEMVMSKLDHDLTIDWGYVEKLLLCYLELNEKKVHKYIVQAFLDVMEVLNGEW